MKVEVRRRMNECFSYLHKYLHPRNRTIACRGADLDVGNCCVELQGYYPWRFDRTRSKEGEKEIIIPWKLSEDLQSLSILSVGVCMTHEK